MQSQFHPGLEQSQAQPSFYRKHRWIHNFHWLHSRHFMIQLHFFLKPILPWSNIMCLAEKCILKSLNFLVTIIEVWVTFWPDFNWKILDHFSNHWSSWAKQLSLEILINLKTMDPCWRLQYGVFLWIRTRSQNLMLPQEEIRGKLVFCWLYSSLSWNLYNCFTLKDVRRMLKSFRMLDAVKHWCRKCKQTLQWKFKKLCTYFTLTQDYGKSLEF